ncbi:MAG: N-succinylarginine dihydrolase [Candidatus Didemnitutus sp.]|nr:N-succinylarginine dihydrolase [Candidatus Didemnitutus sp.]
MISQEVNFDGLVGPTHNFAGLSHGNVASMSHGGRRSNPREAALQGLAKMKFLADLGLPQAVLPPHERPSLSTLRAFGFAGHDAAVLSAAAKSAPDLLVACASASNMWVANAATVTPSRDSADRRVHFTPANLLSKFHRSIEAPQTTRTLRAIFRDGKHFVVHEALPAVAALGDEGAANHTRFAPAHSATGVHLFVHGHRVFVGNPPLIAPKKFASRQALEAFEAIVRRHRLRAPTVVHAQQNPAAIDAGVFHNDVISVGNENVFLYHERAFSDTAATIAAVKASYARLHGGAEFHALAVPAAQVSLRDAVGSYLFNSQIVTLAPDRMALIAPSDCAENPRVRQFVHRLIERGTTPLQAVHYFDLKQSMRNGGGPACLRLRVVLSAEEIAALPPTVMLNDANYFRLTCWVKKHYRDRLTQRDLADPALLRESRRALDELTQLLRLGSIYPFQLPGA